MDRDTAGAHRKLRRIVSERVKRYHDELVASLVPETSRVVRQAVAQARLRRAGRVVKSGPAAG